MRSNQPHPDCICQQRDLTREDLDAMYKAGKYEDINAAVSAGRFKFDNPTNQNQ